MRRERMHRIRLSVIFALFVFVILIITFFIMAAIAFIMIRFGRFDIMSGPSLFPLLALFFASVIVGTLVSFFIGRVPIKPIQKVISAINQLADGDFSVRLELKGPPEFRELGESFNRMAQELSGIEMLRNDFINSFSHEFKTPIGSIRGFAEMLKYGDLTPEERDDYLDTMIKESKRLSVLATNILNLSKVENQTILSETNKFDITEQVRRCILLLEPKWESKGIALSLDLQEISYIGNEEMLAQIWVNLLDNAIKYTAKNGEIDIQLKAEANHILFFIHDTGCGIGSDALAHIFNKFYQEDSSRVSEGNGLGLAVVKKIVELHGGTISCQSEVDVGSKFCVTLPIE